MIENAYVVLPDRGVLAVEGPDARSFLQGLVSNDVMRVTSERAVYAALLTPQGKFLHDFFIAGLGDGLVLDCEGARLADLKRRLGLYKLRAKVTLTQRSDDLSVAVLFGEGILSAVNLPGDCGAARPLDDGVVFVDPRLAGVGARAVLPRGRCAAILEDLGLRPGDRADYERLRIGIGLPDGSRDMAVEKAVLLENGFDELHGVDWQKGCFMGQELTARTRYRGLVKKRLVPVEVQGALPEPGTAVLDGEREVGEIRSGVPSGEGGLALALVRLDALIRSDRAGFTAGGATVVPRKPSWASF